MAEDSAKKMKLSSYNVGVNAVILMPSSLVPTCFCCWQLMEEVSTAVSHLDIFACGWNCSVSQQPSYEINMEEDQ